ncbi:alpha/beta fold hydrolase [Halobaculum marinum]|uniref:Alpha/beta fold hydrolase n=1 Tax=Halobaculum marinum TaxID=3031996 RepID=A0ABD5X2A2_9EURY|nr:alpha/beta hydrolase [Halobaculum sp. DT55]
MEQTTTEHHGRRVAYRYGGDGGGGDDAGLLCVHGSGGTSEVWAGQFRLTDHSPVAALDLSGHGDSDDVRAEPGPETLEAYATDVEAVAEATGSSVLVGHSLGGAVAMWAALELDLDLDGLVLTGTGAKLTVLEDLLVWLQDDFDRAVEFLHGPDRLFHDVDERTLDQSRAAMRDAGRAVVERDFRTCHEFDVRDRLDEIQVPTLAVVGEHDGLTPVSYHEALADAIPECDLAVLDDAAHMAMAERPAAFNDTVGDFLDGL